MTAIPAVDELVAQLTQLGVALEVQGDRLKVHAPAGVIDAAMKVRIAASRDALIDALRLRTAEGSALGRGPAPLTSGQRRIWLFQQLEPESPAYNTLLPLRIEGKLDVPRFEHALNQVVQRHAALHSVVRNEGGREVMVPLDLSARGVSLSVLDIPPAEPDERTAALYAATQAFYAMPFDLARDLPLRAQLLRLAEDQYVLAVVVHHIAADGVSIQIISNELLALYDGQTLPPLSTTYAAYALEEHAYWTDEQLRTRAEYWREELRGASATHGLPLDRARGRRVGTGGRRLQRTVGSNVLSRLNALVTAERATRFMAMQGVLAGALYAAGGERDVVFGTPLHGRDDAQLGELVGMFVGLQPIRMRVSPDATFRSLIQQARETARRGRTPRELPFSALLETLDIPHDDSKHPVFQVLLNLLPPPVRGGVREVGGARFFVPQVEDSNFTLDEQAKFDLTLYVLPQGDELTISSLYDPELFDHNRMAAFLDSVVDLITWGIDHPDTSIAAWVAACQLNAPTGLQTRLAQAGRFVRHDSMPALVAERVRQTPDAIAVLDGTTSLTYAEVWRHAQAVAHRLRSASVGTAAHLPDSPVGVLVPHDAWAVPTLLGALASGRPYVPLDPSYPIARLQLMAGDAGLGTLITVESLRTLAATLVGANNVVLRESLDANGSEVVEVPFPDPQATAYLLYTSGSTGRPKAVVQSHRNLLVQASRYADAMALTPADRLAWLASVSFDASVMDVFGGLVGGAAICAIDRYQVDLAQVMDRVERHALTVLHLTPTAFRTMLGAGGAARSRCTTLRLVVLGGEAVRVGDIEAFDAFAPAGTELFNLYGSSEHSFALGTVLDRAHRSREVPLGWPVGDTVVELRDPDGVPDPVLGELTLRSAHGVREYWNAPALSESAFTVGEEGVTYRTGDIVRRRPDGQLVFLDRRDQQVKVRGNRIELEEVEHRLRRHPAVREVAVHAPGGGDDDRELVACVVPDDAGHPPTAPALAEWCAHALPPFMVPSGWVFVPELPRTPSGKIDRRALPVPERAASRRSLFVEPRDAEESELLAVWHSVLHTDDIGVTDDFFRSGGHSLTATQIVAQVRDLFEVDLPFRQFFDHPTVAETAAWIRAHRTERTVMPPLTVMEKGQTAPLSHSQERIWFQQQLDLDATAYNMGGAGILAGAVDLARIERALHTVARTQESLRTRVILQEGRPVAVVDPEPTHVFQVVDLTAADPATALEEARRIIENRVTAPYRLDAEPLFRTIAVIVRPDLTVFGIGMHHVISDLWSYGVLDRLVRDAFLRDDGSVTIVPSVGYRDYAIWQRQWLRGDALDAQLAYWRQALADVPTLNLTSDFPRPAFLTFEGDSLRMDMRPGLRERIEAFAVERRATPFMVTLAVLNVVLARLSGQLDLAVGSPIAGRTASVTDDLIGTFVNMLVHRNVIDPSGTFDTVLQGVRHTALDAYAHQDMPFELLVKSLPLARDPSRAPIFQVMFNVANARMENRFTSDTEQSTVHLRRPAAQFDLTVTVGLNEVQSDIRLVYNTNLFGEQTARRLLDAYLETLEVALDRPGIPMRDLLSLTSSDASQLGEWNATALPLSGDDDVLVAFARQAATTPDATAISAPDGRYTYGELLDRARQVSAALRARGVKPGDRIAVLMERRRDLLAVLLGILGAGAAYLPLDPKYPEARLRFIIEDAGVEHIVSQRDVAQRFTGLENVVLDEQLVANDPAPFTVVDGAMPAYVIYTSGSTGTPKGVEVTRGNVANFLMAMRQQPGMAAHDVLLAVTTISFDIAVLELYLPLTVGAHIVLIDEADALDGRRLQQRMLDHGVTIMQATPATWKLLVSAGWTGAPTTLRVLCGGEALSRQLADQLLARASQVWNMYGPTETTVWSTLDLVDEGPICVGRPIANTTLHVLDPEGEPVAIGRSGELHIGGAGVANGYVNRPELTADRFVTRAAAGGARVYGTGDLVRMRADGRLEHLGRLDHQVKVRGFRIELGEVESALRGHVAVEDAAAGVDGDRLIGYVVFRPGEMATTSDVRRWVATSLPPHMVPNQIIVLDAMPLTPNGKLDRRALPLTSANTGDVSAPRPAGDLPADPSLAVIRAVWAELLGHDEIHDDDNFFEIGGHSLLAMEAIARIEARTGHRLDPRALFFRSLSDLAGALSDATVRDT